MRRATISSYQLPDGTVPVLLSAETPGLLRNEAAAILSYVVDRPDVTPGRIAEMLFRTRSARRNRALSMVTDRDELIIALRAVADDVAHPSVVRTNAPATARRLAYVFPGQGGQRPGMGRLYYDSAPAFRTEVDRCDDIFRELFGESPLKYVLDENVPADDSAQIVQPALFMQMAGLAAMWRSVGIEPDATIGHSQGEIAAAYVAGRMTLADAILVVGTRAHAVDKIASDDYAMAVVAADRDECEELLARRSGWAQVSVINSPNMVGISGDRDTVQDLVDTLAENGRFARVIRVRYAAHTGLVNEFRDDIRDAVRNRLANQYFLDSEIDCIGATLGGAITPDLPVDEYWFWNLRNTVRFDKAIAAAVAQQVDMFVELAEHPTLQLSVQENLGPAHHAMVSGTSNRSATDLSDFSRNLAEIAVHNLNYPWECLRTESDGAVRLPLPDFPNVQMNEVRLWLPYNSGHTRSVEPSAADTVAESSTETIAPQLLVEDWVRLVRRSLTPPRAIGIIDHTGNCAELAAALCTEATNHGASARLIDIGNDTVGADLDSIVVLLPNLPDMSGYDATAETAEFFGARRWWPGLTDGVADCWLVTVGGEAVLADDRPPHPFHAAASAGFRCIGTEHPGIAFRHLDLAPEQALPSANKSGSSAAAAIVMALHTAGESELALRSDSLYAKRLTEADRDVTRSPSATPENVVIIGGTGSLGLEFCKHFAGLGAQRITLVSRSGETPAVTERLRRSRASGSAEIRVIACDVGDNDAVLRLANEHRDAPANLIIHAAADYSDMAEIRLADITPEQVHQMLWGKVIGISNVLDSLALADDCHVVLCSSLAATLGGRGKIVYAAANRMLDAFAHRLRAEGVDCVSVQWGQWAVYKNQSAADAAQLAAVGYVPMRSADAIALGLSGLGDNAIVAAFDWARGHSVLDAYGYGPVLSQLVEPVAVPHEPVATGHEPAEKVDLPRRMTQLLAEVIGADDIGTIDNTRSLVALGLDSLQALDFRRRIKAEFDRDLPVAELLGGASIDDVVRLFGAHPQVATKPPVAPEPSVAPKPSLAAKPSAAQRPVATQSPVDIAEHARQTAEQAIPDDMDSDRMRSARRDLDLYGLRSMMNTLDPVLRDGAVHTVDEIVTQLEFAPRHRWLLNRWLSELTTNGCLDYDPDRGYQILGPVPAPTRSDLFAVSADLGYSREFAIFLQSADEHLTELAQDRVRVQELLFPDGDMLTAEAAYRDNVISRYLNLAAREVVAGIAGRLAHDRSPVRILELGAGVGGTTSDVVAGLSGLPVDYHFTDLSTFFLGAARERFAEYPWMRYGIMDMNADLGQQSGYDVVIAANVLHNAHHIREMLSQLHDLLNPGGAVVFIEACRANYPLLTSMKFLMSPANGQPHPGLSDIRAGARIFLTETEWQDQLTASGFTPMLVLPDADHPMYLLDQRVFAAIRDQ